MTSPCSTVDYVVPRNESEVFALGKFTCAYVDPTKIPTPTATNATCRKTLEFAKAHLHPAVLNHSLRAYTFASYLLLTGFPSASPGVEQISISKLQERLWMAALFHDTGFADCSAEGRNPDKDAEAHMSFEFNGGFVAKRYLEKWGEEGEEGAPEPKALGDIVESIFMHTSALPTGKCSALGRLMNFATGLDVIGWSINPLYRKLYNYQMAVETEKLYPRLDLGDVFSGKMEEEVTAKPWCLITKEGPGFLDVLRSLKTLADGH